MKLRKKKSRGTAFTAANRKRGKFIEKNEYIFNVIKTYDFFYSKITDTFEKE